MFEIAPSILSADFTRLADEIAAVKAGGAKMLHVDVMDGHFVPNITIGLPVVKSLRKATDMTIDTHLMISDPGRYAVEFVKAGAYMVTMHVEGHPHLERDLVAVQGDRVQSGNFARNVKRSVAICRFCFANGVKSRVWWTELHTDNARQVAAAK